MAYAYYREMPAALVSQAINMLPEWMVDVSMRFDEIVNSKQQVRQKSPYVWVSLYLSYPEQYKSSVAPLKEHIRNYEIKALIPVEQS